MGKGIKGAAIGAAIGGGLGLAGTVSSTVATARANQQIMTQSPFYNQSALNAERLNASGNIVLGMHNQRRG
jgi:cellulase/cellobiase CelA1